MISLLERLVVPSRLALVYRGGETLGYNPSLNTWERLDEPSSEMLRWLRAKRDRAALENFLVERFGYSNRTAKLKIEEIAKWCILRRLLYLDREPPPTVLVHSVAPLATVYWICTQACNLRCSYCYQDAMKARRHELSTEEARMLIDQVVDVGAKTFILTGGEPFSRRDLLELAFYSKSRGLRTNVITNGHYITAKNVQAAASTFDLVTISLDHTIPAHHDQQRGKGSWQKAVRGIDLLLEAGARVDINSVLSKFGLADLKELLQLRRLKRIGQHKIVPQFPMGRGQQSRGAELTPSELLSLGDELEAARRGIEGDQSGLRPEGSQGNKGSCRNHCGAGLSEVSIDPEGWVYPCKLLQYPQFRTQNVRAACLAKIFREDPLLQRIQETVVDRLKPCATCIIKNNCGGGCRGIQYSFTGNYINADSLFCAFLRRSFEVQAWRLTGGVPTRRRSEFKIAVVS